MTSSTPDSTPSSTDSPTPSAPIDQVAIIADELTTPLDDEELGWVFDEVHAHLDDTTPVLVERRVLAGLLARTHEDDEDIAALRHDAGVAEIRAARLEIAATRQDLQISRLLETLLTAHTHDTDEDPAICPTCGPVTAYITSTESGKVAFREWVETSLAEDWGPWEATMAAEIAVAEAAAADDRARERAERRALRDARGAYTSTNPGLSGVMDTARAAHHAVG